MKKKLILATLLASFALLSTAHAAEWKFDKAHSRIRFKVKHMMVTNVWGEFHTFDGKVFYDPDHPEKSSVNVTIDVNSVDTGNDTRDNDLRSERFFYVEKYPKATFVSNKVDLDSTGLSVTGNLTIRGVTKEVVLKVEDPVKPFPAFGGVKTAASATTEINRYDYGLTWNKTLETGGVLVDPIVDLFIDVELNEKN